ncbi:hypothetical protein NB231_07857, partial [Nitrococcus mobilis Nb-231]
AKNRRLIEDASTPLRTLHILSVVTLAKVVRWFEDQSLIEPF